MLEEIKYKYLQLKAKDEALEQELVAIGAATTAKKPTEDAWSLNEIAHHLVLVEQGVKDTLREKLLTKADAWRSSFKSAVKFFLLQLVLKSPLRVKVPSKRVLPSSDVDLAQLQDSWQEIHKTWPDVLGQFKKNDLDKQLFKHPIAGWLNIIQTLDFLLAHTDHHLAQVDRTKTKLGIS